MSEVGLALMDATGMWGSKIADALEHAPGASLVTCFARDADRLPCRLGPIRCSDGLFAHAAGEAEADDVGVVGLIVRALDREHR